jgi:hypothetical protein
MFQKKIVVDKIETRLFCSVTPSPHLPENRAIDEMMMENSVCPDVPQVAM